ncbi:MAG: T9SS type A sorting domain-containing protein [Bacteroidales bacterium]|nr:T9SS type A sorting domain-containing protein [Bacteroidales bacterium]
MIDLSSYSGNQNVKLGWQYVGNDGDVMAIDSVLLTGGVTGIDDHFEEEVGLKNYPNPFSNQTTISFSLTERQKVKLEIVNILGKVVDVLVDANLNKGSHSVVYSINGGVSGIYFYRLTINNRTIVRKMIRIK